MARALLLDTKGFDKMVAAIAPDKRKEVLRGVMLRGINLMRDRIRAKYRAVKPGSDLGSAIVTYVYPSGEGATVRRFYIKGGTGSGFSKTSSFYRAYILNFIEKGAQGRVTRGRVGTKYAGKRLNRGSIPAYKFFQKGFSGSRNAAYKQMEREVLAALAQLARKQ